MGLMGETAKATVSAGGKVIGVTTAGLSAKGRSVVTGIQELQTKNLSKRKETMVSLSDAFITMPGGIGTLDEFFSALFNVEGYFDPLVQMLDDSCEKGLNSTDWHEYGSAFSDCKTLMKWLES